jgi:hypothetical protein
VAVRYLSNYCALGGYDVVENHHHRFTTANSTRHLCRALHQTGQPHRRRTNETAKFSLEGSGASAALDVTQNFFGLKALNRQRALIMAGPIAFTLSETIDKQRANAVSAD